MTEAIIEPELPICDPHHHLWDFPASVYLLPELLADTDAGHNVQSTVFVECTAYYRASGPENLRLVGETEFVNGVAAMAASGRYGDTLACEGIVSRANLSQGASVEETLASHERAGNGRFRGIRHVTAWHASPDINESHTKPTEHLMADAKFREGFAKLAKFDMSFDAWLYHTQIDELADLAAAFPYIPIVLDHVGGPLGIGPFAGKREEVFAVWRQSIRNIAERPNVVVKLGGLGMPICGFDFHKRDKPATSEELAAAWKPYIETCIEAFGPERCMFESNFPVDRASCDYVRLWNAFKRIAAGASASEKALLFRDTARRFYRLD